MLLWQQITIIPIPVILLAVLFRASRVFITFLSSRQCRVLWSCRCTHYQMFNLIISIESWTGGFFFIWIIISIRILYRYLPSLYLHMCPYYSLVNKPVIAIEYWCCVRIIAKTVRFLSMYNKHHITLTQLLR